MHYAGNVLAATQSCVVSVDDEYMKDVMVSKSVCDLLPTLDVLHV